MSKRLLRLRHIDCSGLTHYAAASKLQEQLASALLLHKKNKPVTAPPQPTVITAQFYPVYTCGRREIRSVDPAHIEFLRDNGRAEFYASQRGGETTFHGPGQLVAYPIIDLLQHGLSPRNYVKLLEDVTIAMCAHEFGVHGFRTDNPGVWVNENEKICAVGVHLRRNVTSHGIGLNVTTDLRWFERTVMCGMADKRATSLEKQLLERKPAPILDVADVGSRWVTYFAQSLAAAKGWSVTDAEIEKESGLLEVPD